MKGCARSCLLWLGGWGAASYAFYLYFSTLGDLGDPLPWISGGAGLCAMAVVAYFLGIVHAARERTMLLDTMTGAPLEDGKWVAVSGRIHSMHKLHAPLSGESVVAYTYKVWRMEGSGKSRSQVNHYEGKALVPSTISGRSGSVRLLAVPTFDFPAEKLTPERAIEKLQAHIAGSQFETPDTPKKLRATVEREWTDDDGNYRVDKRSSGADAVPLEDCQFEETHVKQNESVCAFGMYSQARGGLVPHPNWSRQTRLMRGDAETVAGQLRSRMIKYSVGIVAFGGIAFGIVRACQIFAAR